MDRKLQGNEELHLARAQRGDSQVSDGSDTLFYLDPPYVYQTRTARDAYQYEMDDQQHARLIEAIFSCRGKVVISGYANKLYDHALRGWERHEIDMPNHSSQSKCKQRRIEILWLNPACVSGWWGGPAREER
jgi:DNA adenine methylase